MPVLYILHKNSDIVFQSISCHTLKFAELRGEYEYIVGETGASSHRGYSTVQYSAVPIIF